jgi:hypothetical protein
VASLNNVTTGDSYSNQTSVIQQNLARINLIVSGSAILYQLADRWPPGSEWAEEKYLPPGMYSFERDCHGIRVRSAVPGQPAQVVVDALTPSEVAR